MDADVAEPREPGLRIRLCVHDDPVDVSAIWMHRPQQAGGHDRTKHDLDARIAQLWDAQLAVHPRMYNASKFRLAWSEVRDDGVHLGVGLTDYRETLCTHSLDDALASAYAEAGEASGDAHRFLACGMGCELLMLTRDGYVPLIERSQHVGSHHGMLQCAGSGHYEPASVGVTDAASLAAVPEERLQRLLEDGVVSEAVDECNVPREAVRGVQFLGIVSDQWKPGLMFAARCELDFAQLQARYAQGCAEGFESTRLLGLRPQALAREPRLTPMTRGMVYLAWPWLRRRVGRG